MFFGGLKKIRRPAKKPGVTSSGAKSTNNNYFEKFKENQYHRQKKIGNMLI